MENEYDDYDYDEYITSPKEEEMNMKGFTFITNFHIDREEIYRKAAEIHNLRYFIENETYSSHGKKIGNGEWDKAFYVDANVNDLTDFWNTCDLIKEHNSKAKKSLGKRMSHNNET